MAVQLVGYDTGAGPRDEARPPALVVAEDGTASRRPLSPGTELAYTLGERHCAGTTENGRHEACSAADAPYCPEHTGRWACARCTGDCDRPLSSCREEHAVYLAAFAPATFKVGVTRSWRLETRLREQGADRAAHVATVDDGRIARRLEADIATEVGDRVRVPTKVEGLHRPVDPDAWADLLADHDVRREFAFDHGLDLTGRPVPEVLATGEVRGTQGRVLVLDNGGTTYAVDMRDLVGHEATAERAARSLQSSLGAF